MKEATEADLRNNLKAICILTNVEIEKVLSKSRKRIYSDTRAAFVTIVRNRYPGISEQTIGNYLGRAHSTLSYHLHDTCNEKIRFIKRIENLIEKS